MPDKATSNPLEKSPKIDIGPLMIDVEGFTLTSNERELIGKPLVGGLILFARNYQSPAQLTTLITEIREISTNIIIAVDHEGGRVQRFKEGFTRIPAMATLGELYETNPKQATDNAKDYAWLLASELISFDIDISFTPVLDREYGVSSVIGDRAFSSNVDCIIDLAKAFISGMRQAGMASTGKHFPGHGAVAADSHHEIPVDDRSYDDIHKNDMCVFSALSSSGLDAVMPAHVIYPEVDDKPAGFSEVWMQTILRGELGFDGVIFSDDLSMEGASVAGSFSQRAKAALDAGCDMVLVCNHPEGAQEVLQYLETLVATKQLAINNSRLVKMRLDPSCKQTMGEIQKSKIWQKFNQ
jgi:beta-N-acetylhexosaminidase